MDRSETTNSKIDAVLADLETLIAWAEADAQTSYESGSPQQAYEDRKRAARLRRAADYVGASRR